VEHAFALGWHVAELCNREDRDPRASDYPLVSLGALDRATRRNLLVAQISADLDTLGLERRGPVRPGNAWAATGDGSVGPLGEIVLPAASIDEVKVLHAAVLTRLMVKDFELGKAYSLGAGLGQMVLEAYRKLGYGTAEVSLAAARKSLHEVFTDDRVVELWSYVKDLKSRFAPYAADPVARTLWDWSTWAADTSASARDGRNADDGKAVADRLRRQGQIWRALLSGERKPTDFLLFGNYLDAAADMLRQYGRVAVRVISRKWGALILALLMIVLAVATYFVAQRLTSNSLAWLVAALAALGVSGASVLATMKRALGQVEKAMWETEITRAIVAAIRFVPGKPPGSLAFGFDDDDPRPSGPVVEGGTPPKRRGWLRGLPS
jgi:hypothetical protein